MANANKMIFDDVLRTIQERRPGLIVPLINEVFGTKYPLDIKVERLPEEYQTMLSKVIMDSCNRIGNRIYHLECQSGPDGSRILRMIEYDFMIGMVSVKKQEKHFKMKMPHSCVIFLRNATGGLEGHDLEIEMADGSKVFYRIPVVKAQSYDLDEIFQKKLFILLPYYILRYERIWVKASDWNKDENYCQTIKTQIVMEYEEIIRRLEKELKDDTTGLFLDMVGLMRRVLEYTLQSQPEIKKGVLKVMGGNVLPLPSDALREERAAGESRVNMLNKILIDADRVDDIIRSANDREYQQQLFKEFHIE